MTRIIFDVTDLRQYLSFYVHFTGIQRVMVMMIDELALQAEADKIWLGYCGKDAEDYQVFPYSALGPAGMADIANLSSVLGQSSPGRRTLPTLQGYADKPLKYQFHKLVRNINARMGRDGHFTQRGATIDVWRASAQLSDADVKQTKPQSVFEVCSTGDWLVMLDAGWADKSWKSPENWRHRLRAKGVQIAILVHDLIQIQHPEYIPGTNSMVFYKWLHSTLDTADVYLANSKATAQDLQAFVSEYGATQPIHVLPLAQHTVGKPPKVIQQNRPVDDPELSDIPSRYAKLAETRDMDGDIRALLKWPYVLCVGTMDIRKNLWALSHVWQRLSQNKDITLPKLVFVGRKGSFNEDFNRLMQATGQLGGWAEIHHTVSDSELDFLYRNCLFTVMPSFYEGWGLPIGESLSYGKTGVVSQTSSMPEVGLDLVEYCDPYNMASIEAACLKLIAQPEHRAALEARISKTKLRSWSDVSHDLLDFLELPTFSVKPKTAGSST